VPEGIRGIPKGKSVSGRVEWDDALVGADSHSVTTVNARRGIGHTTIPGASCYPVVTPRNISDPEWTSKCLKRLADPIRFERTASAFGGQRSIQLSYGSRDVLLQAFLAERKPGS
jgi:hypothetical protein